MQNIFISIKMVGHVNFNRLSKLLSCKRTLCSVKLHGKPLSLVRLRQYNKACNSVLYTSWSSFHLEKHPSIQCCLRGQVRQCHGSVSSESSIDNVNTIEETGHIDVDSVVAGMIDKALERDRMVAVIDKSVLKEHTKNLLDLGFSEYNIIDLAEYPQIIKNLSQLVEMITVLLDYGVKKQELPKIINSYPDIIHLSKSIVKSKIKLLQDNGFKLELIARLISKHPGLLGENLSGVPQRIQELQLLFKTKDTFSILEKSPELLNCDLDHITQRFNYVFHEMGITQPQMRHSGLFSYPMEHIYTRHMFLVRAGFFKKLKKKDGQRDLNPKLDKILDTTDKAFVKMFGNMTLQDYETFKQLLKRDQMILKNVEEFDADY